MANELRGAFPALLLLEMAVGGAPVISPKVQRGVSNGQ